MANVAAAATIGIREGRSSDCMEEHACWRSSASRTQPENPYPIRTPNSALSLELATLKSVAEIWLPLGKSAGSSVVRAAGIHARRTCALSSSGRERRDEKRSCLRLQAEANIP